LKPEELAQGVYRISKWLPGVTEEFAVYFIKDTEAAIIEPGPSAIVPEIQQALADLGIGEPKYIIPTHIHLDHAGAVGRLLQIYPGAKAVFNRQGAKHAIEPARLIKSTRMAFGQNFEDTYGAILPVPEAGIKVVADGEKLKVGRRELMIYTTPGHAPHHIAIMDSLTQGLFSGEALGLIYSPGYPPLPAMAPPSFDQEQYIKDMERLAALHPKLLYYTHGTISREPEKMIPLAIKNSRLIGAFFRAELQKGLKDEDIIKHFSEYLKSQFGAHMDEYELVTNAHGLIHYYRRKGLAKPV